jgi:hypothetical protein
MVVIYIDICRQDGTWGKKEKIMENSIKT